MSKKKLYFILSTITLICFFFLLAPYYSPPKTTLPPKVQQKITYTPSYYLNKNSFHIIPFYLYARQKELGSQSNWIKHLISTCFPNKSIDFETLHQTLQLVKKQPPQKHILSVEQLIAHLIYYPKEECTVSSAIWQNQISLYDLKQQGVPENMLSFLAIEYCRLSPNVFLAAIMPMAIEKRDAILKTVPEYASLIYDKAINIHHFGPRNYLHSAYGILCDAPHQWIDNPKGIHKHIASRFSTNNTTHILLIEASDAETVLNWKQTTRKKLKAKTVSLHATDTSRETLGLAQMLLHENSLHFLNYGYHIFQKSLIEKIKSIKNEHINLNSNLEEDAYINKSGALIAFGINFPNRDPSLELSSSLGGSQENDLIIYDPNQYFYFNFMKFASPL